MAGQLSAKYAALLNKFNVDTDEYVKLYKYSVDLQGKVSTSYGFAPSDTLVEEVQGALFELRSITKGRRKRSDP
jgi:hypothetical protein